MPRLPKPPKPKSVFIARLPLFSLLAIERASERLIAETQIELLTCKKQRRAILERTAQGTATGLAAVRYEIDRRAQLEVA